MILDDNGLNQLLMDYWKSQAFVVVCGK